MKKLIISLLTLFILLLVSCKQTAETPTPLPPTTTPIIVVSPTETAVVDQPTVNSQQPTVNSQQPTENEAPATNDPPPATPNATQNTSDALVQNQPLPRDPIALAIAYDGISPQPVPTREIVTTPLTTGTRHQLKVLNTDSIIVNEIEAELKAVGDHAYFWFETDSSVANPTAAELAQMAASFDEIYEQVIAIFGSEGNPGLDGDARIHIVNADPGTICDDANACGLLGYFSASDIIPVHYDANSNEREMFVMNGSTFGTEGYLDTLAHEFRHMVEANYDAGDIDWAVEGSAVLAQDLLGYSDDGIYRANLFLENPDQQLNSWPDGFTTAAYGQGYLLNRYIYNRLGPDLYREFATHPASGLDAVTAVAAQHNLDLDGETLYHDWLTALAIHDQPGADPKYELREGVETAVMTTIHPGQGIDDTVHQYAADYYQLGSGHKQYTISFDGSETVPLIPAPPASGEMMWLANRANYSQAQLTRLVDLTGVETATLNYKVFHEIEQGYDFAYVAVSEDNACTEPCRSGRSWQPLTAPHMQGLDPEHDPSHSAYADRFYTSSSNGWVQETIDLTPYAGQEILLRFEYVTDEIYTESGLALDDINIPEIGFYDDAESLDEAWTADGFIRATGSIPQQWHLQLITFPDGTPQVQFLPLDEAAAGIIELNLAKGEQPPILIVAATAPMTLQPASYSLAIR
ncbi:MAG: immune inhibitor A [Anaerolineae bacterium]|nr:immune inhibitor A [Anaerolineae bacterium]